MIQPAGAAHAAALAALHQAAFPPDEAWNQAAFAGLLSTPGVLALVDPAGGMVLARVAADEAEILTIAVLPARRRHGLGRSLLDAASLACATSGAASLYLEVSKTNPAALALYRAAGFTQVGSRRRYYPDGADALLLRLPLTPGAAADA